MSGIERIAAERQRQMDVEGWTHHHDDTHTAGELAAASDVYAHLARLQVGGYDCEIYFRQVPPAWPWHSDWWKPSRDPARNLEKAGALAAAEIDRLERLRG